MVCSSLSRRVYRFCVVFFLMCAFLICVFLGIGSVFSTAFFRVADQDIEVNPLNESIMITAGLPSVFFLFGVLAILCIILPLSGLLRWCPSRWRPAMLFMVVLVISCAWLCFLQAKGSFWYNDSQSLLESAAAFVQGDYGRFVSGQPEVRFGVPNFYNYFSWYPYQLGGMLWFAAQLKIVGVGNIFGLQIINAFLTSGMAVCIYYITRMMGISDRVQRVLMVVIALFLPMEMLSAFVYNNTGGLFFVVVGMLCVLSACRAVSPSRRYVLLGTGFLLSAVAMSIKGTVVIFVIAVSIASVLFFLMRKQYVGAIGVIILFVMAKQISNLPVFVVEHITGVSFGKGIPQLAWVQIGLEGNGNNSGWWTSVALDAYNICGGELSCQSKMISESLRSIVLNFMQNPISAMDFFAHKLTSEWAEPTYQSLYYSGASGNGVRILLNDFPRLYKLLISYMNVFQSILYIFAAMGLWKSYRENDEVAGFVRGCVALTVIGGFTCFLFWEAKSVYTFPFALMMTPFASLGIEDLFQVIKRHRGFRVK